MRKNGKKIVVAMSGGVYSSVAAALLKKRGFEVEGIFMKLFNSKQLTVNSHEKHAKSVAEKLGIRFKVLNLRKEFKKRVIDYFLKEFKAGRTPNPCVVCNQQIKFGLLLDESLGMGADYIATGHYARIKISPNLPFTKGGTPSFVKGGRGWISKLLTAKDKIKDQSYFLYNLTQKKLAKILFPLEDYKKLEVYKMAEKWDLPYKKGESVDICFIGRKGHREFLKKHLKIKPGKIIDASGKVLGKHQGLWFYTIGQRADIGGPGPFYVVELDVENNAVVVSNKFRDEALYKKSLVAENVNWISGIVPKTPLKCRARIRYHHAAVPCVIARRVACPQRLAKHGRRAPRQSRDITKGLFRSAHNDEQNNYIVEFKNPQRAITPGQLVVFYKRNEVLGGGVIKC